MGDGRVLQKLVEEHKGDSSIGYVGIEKDKQLTDLARMRVNIPNVTIINALFEHTMIHFCDQCIDIVVMVLPDPIYIDPVYHEKWIPFYTLIHSKLKEFGVLKIVTEITDDLLGPVSDEVYSMHVTWLVKAFLRLGFKLLIQRDGPPLGYTSLFLDKFMADPQRIRIVTLDFVKAHTKEPTSISCR